MIFEPYFLEIKNAQNRLSDIIRIALYDSNSTLFDKLSFENDHAFLEPALFCYFLSDIGQDKKVPLEQCLYGYITPRPKEIIIHSDIFGFANLPNLGYLKVRPSSSVEIDEDYINENLIPNNYHEVKNFTYHNQPYIFQYPLF